MSSLAGQERTNYYRENKLRTKLQQREQTTTERTKKREQTTISKLVDEQGIQKSSPKEILNMAQTFYSKLYQKDETSIPEQNFSWA